MISAKTISSCPWNINVTFECTVHGGEGDNTVWQGTAFNDCDNDEITLLHNRFGGEGTAGVCNNGTITGRSLNVTMGNDSNHSIYSSQLVVIVRSGMIGKCIMCLHDDINYYKNYIVGSAHLNINTSDSVICMHTSTSMNVTSMYTRAVKGIVS